MGTYLNALLNSFVHWMYLLPFLLCMDGFVLLLLRQVRANRHTRSLLCHLRKAHNELSATHKELSAAHAQLAAYAVEVEELAQVNERQRLARELHDTLAQNLASLVLYLEAVDARLEERKPESAREIVQHAMLQARATFTATRYAIHDLRATPPERHSLTATVQEEIRRFSAATNVPCHTDLRLLEAVPAPLHEQVIQTIREALTNVARHAYAHDIWIDVKESGKMFDIEIRDNGVGFDPMQTGNGHYGVLGLRERARQTGGWLEIHSAPGEGALVRLSLPCTQEQREEIWAL